MADLKPHKTDESDAQWVLPFADLMTLLLVMFVTLAAMGDIRPGRRFDQVTGGVRAAFGFGSSGPAELSKLLTTNRKPSLVERLEQAGLTGKTTAQLSNGNGERLAPCEMVADRGQVTLQVPGDSSFDRFSATLRPEAGKLLIALAALLNEGYITEGRTRIEIRGYAGDGAIPDTAAFRDPWDLSYERAKVVADTLTRAGVARGRISIVAMGEATSTAAPKSTAGLMPDTAPATGRRIEMTVYAAQPGGHAKGIADKEPPSHG